MSGLSEKEQDSLILAFIDPGDDCAHNMIPAFAVVEAIIAARASAAVEAFRAKAVAAIEAAAEKWQPVIPAPDGWDLGYIHRRQGQRHGREAAARIVGDLNT